MKEIANGEKTAPEFLSSRFGVWFLERLVGKEWVRPLAMADQCNFTLVLSAHQLRPTPLRLKVLEVLASENRPRLAREILEAVQKQRPAHKVSIYRILEDFKRLGMVREVSSEGGKAYFELACEHHPPHPHFHCRSCGLVQCLAPVALEHLRQELGGATGHRVEEVEVKASGFCSRCQKTEIRGGEGDRK